MWVTPEVVSYVSREVDSEHGTSEVVVRAITARTSVRTAFDAVFANGKLTEAVTPPAAVNEVAEPMTAPDAFRKEIVPVQDAAVPLDEATAVFVALT